MIEVALFGAGRIGKIHGGNLARQPGVKLKYVVDVNAAAAGELAQAHGAKVADVETALKDAAVSAVVIASSTDTHADLIIRSAARRRPSSARSRSISPSSARVRASTRYPKPECLCMIGFQRRFDPTFSALKQRLDAGEVGNAEMLIITSRDPGPPPISYIKVSGGIFKDMLIHDFDVFRWVLEDEAQTVHAVGSCLVDQAIGTAGDVDSTAVTIRTRGGRLCQINTSRRAAYGYDQRFEVLGSQGLLQARNHTPTQVVAQTAVSVSEDKPEHFFLERYRVAYALEIAHFFDALTNGKPIRTTLQDGVKALELAEAATLSWREGRVVAL